METNITSEIILYLYTNNTYIFYYIMSYHQSFTVSRSLAHLCGRDHYKVKQKLLYTRIIDFDTYKLVINKNNIFLKKDKNILVHIKQMDEDYIYDFFFCIFFYA